MTIKFYLKNIVTILVTLLLLISSTKINAQNDQPKKKQSKIVKKIKEITTFEYNYNNTEAGINLGMSSYNGDLKTEEYTWNQSSLSGGLMLRNSLNKWIGVRTFLNYGQLRGDDALSHNSELIKRNLSFKSTIFEIGVAGEFNLPIRHNFGYKEGKADRYYKAVPYAFVGINLFHFNPKTYYNGGWVELQPLHTEGKENEYHLTQIAIPYGIGVKYPITNRMNLAIEFGFRKTFTDYIDDVSTNYPDLKKLSIEESDLSADLSCRTDELPGKSGFIPKIGLRRGNSNKKDSYLMNCISLRIDIGAKY